MELKQERHTSCVEESTFVQALIRFGTPMVMTNLSRTAFPFMDVLMDIAETFFGCTLLGPTVKLNRTHLIHS